MDKKRFLKNIGFLLAPPILALPSLALAFETKFPAIPGVPSPSDLLSFINYLYYFLLIVGAMVSSLSLIYGGVIYFFSSGNPGKTFFAKQQIFASFTGLGILLLSFVILNFLNPDLTIARLPNLPIISGPGLLPIIPPEQRVMSYWELPIGELEDNVLNKTSALIQPADLSQPVEYWVKKLKDESIYLKSLLQSCQCSNLKSDCDAAQCGNQLKCKKFWGGTPDKIDLCPNLAAIENQQNIIKATQNELKSAREPLLSAKINLQIALIKLSAARSLLKSCLPSPMDLNTFLGIQDVQGIEKKIFFSDTSAKKHPLTFYCDLDEDFVLASMDYLKTRIQELLARFNFGMDGCTGDCSEGTGYCAVSNLRNYFPTEQSAREASAICQGESSSLPLNDNLACLRGATLDYSIGLFQINLLAHCPQAITYTLNPITCTIINQAELDQCVQYYHIPENNIKKAVALYNESLAYWESSGWYPWYATASMCGIIGGLPECGGPPPIVVDGFSMPLNNACITSPWDIKRSPTYCHDGTDFISGDFRVFASADGRVSAVNNDPNSNDFGRWVAVKHNIQGHTFYTFYAHLGSLANGISVDKDVSAGQPIGIMGNTGSGSAGVHLHFGIYTSFSDSYGWPSGNDVNPQSYLPLPSVQCCPGQPYQSWCAEPLCN